jgi:hypothetical protein
MGQGDSFLFSLRDDENFMTLKCLKRENEVYHHPGYMPTFGYGL